MNKLDKKAVWLFVFQNFLGSVVIVAATGTLLRVWRIFNFDETYPGQIIEADPQYMIHNPVIFWIIIFVISFILAYALSYLNYYFYKYELSDLGFKKEFGIIYKKYVTIPYDKIQNVDIHRNLISRILGLSDLQIQTAGISGYYGFEGRLPGLSPKIAEEIRDELVRRSGKSKGQGL